MMSHKNPAEDRGRRRMDEMFSNGATPRPRPSTTSSDKGPFGNPEFVELSTVQEEDESFDSTRRGTSEYPARARQSPSTAQEEELPDLIIEVEPPKPDKHDDPPEFYRALTTRMRRIHKRWIIDNKSGTESTDLELSPSRPNKRRLSFGELSDTGKSPTDSSPTDAAASKVPSNDSPETPETSQNENITSNNANTNAECDEEYSIGEIAKETGDDAGSRNRNENANEEEEKEGESVSDREDSNYANRSSSSNSVHFTLITTSAIVHRDPDDNDYTFGNDVIMTGDDKNGDDEVTAGNDEHGNNKITPGVDENGHDIITAGTKNGDNKATTGINDSGNNGITTSDSENSDDGITDNGDDEITTDDHNTRALPSNITLCDEEDLDENKNREDSNYANRSSSSNSVHFTLITTSAIFHRDPDDNDYTFGNDVIMTGDDKNGDDEVTAGNDEHGNNKITPGVDENGHDIITAGTKNGDNEATTGINDSGNNGITTSDSENSDDGITDNGDDEITIGDHNTRALPSNITLCDEEDLDENIISEEKHHIEEMRSARRHVSFASHGQRSFDDIASEAPATTSRNLSTHTHSLASTGNASVDTDDFPHRDSSHIASPSRPSRKRRSTSSSTSSPSRRTRFAPREQESIIMEQIRRAYSGSVIREYKPCFCQDHVCREKTRYGAMDRITYKKTRNVQYNLCSCTHEEHSCSYTET